MRAVLYEWIMILISIFTVTLIYIIFSPVISDLINLGVQLNVGANALQAVQTYWYWFLIVFVAGLFIYGIVSAARVEPEEFYYER